MSLKKRPALYKRKVELFFVTKPVTFRIHAFIYATLL